MRFTENLKEIKYSEDDVRQIYNQEAPSPTGDETRPVPDGRTDRASGPERPAPTGEGGRVLRGQRIKKTMDDKFHLKVISENDEKKVFFANNTDDFVEVLLDIDGRELKQGRTVSDGIRGYCYPPRYQRAIAKLKTGQALPFGAAGIVSASVFSGQALRKEEELDVPTFIWRKMPRRSVRFTRDNNQPIVTLQEAY